jgi:cyclopropane-fatty-acyl-phospholipid synthase
MATQADIEAHYDVDNDFFALFLDKKYLAYTTGVWGNSTSLEQAQEVKFDRLSQYANIKPSQHIMDVGCGWGGYMNDIVDKYAHTHVHGLTISTEQFKYINNTKKANVSVDLRPWQSYPKPEQKFDAIVSVCAFEHFASLEDNIANRHRDVYKDFFDWCLDISTQEAQFALQTIVITRPPNNLTELRGSKYLQKVFPGSAMASISDIQAAIVDKYEIAALSRVGLDYVPTLTEWKRRLELNKDIIIERYGETLFEHYRTYFTGAISCFETGYLDVLQVSLKRAKSVRVLAD